MKKYTIHTLVPALALLAVGCSTPAAMQSTEYDDMYYTSSDKTEYIQPAVTAQAEEIYGTEEAIKGGGVINPEYTDESAVLDNYNGDEYYDGRSYDPRDNWYQPNYSYVDPSWGSAYAPRYSSRYHMAMRDPFYDPFYYDPFYYDSFYSPFRRPYWGSGVSVSIAFGSVWGNPYLGHPYAARPYYSSWYPYNNYYNGFNQGYYYGQNQYIYDRPGYFQARQIQRGPRNDRSSIVTGNNRDGNGRPDRGTLSSENGQQAVMPGTDVNARPSRTRGSRVGAENSTAKEVITTRPDVTRRTRTQRVAPRTGGEQRQEVVPVERTTRTRTRGEVSPARETRQQPVRQQVRPVERRERTAPVRQTPVRNYEQRSETRSVPVRSSSSGSGSGSSSSERRSGGRPTRGGN